MKVPALLLISWTMAPTDIPGRALSDKKPFSSEFAVYARFHDPFKRLAACAPPTPVMHGLCVNGSLQWQFAALKQINSM